VIGIALVRHRRRALLLLAEKLLGLAHLGLLQMADLGGDLVERARDHRQHAEVVGVAVALDHLRADLSAGEVEALADGIFVLRLEVRAVAHRAAQLAHAHLFGGVVEALEVALASRCTSSRA
jgi:hypothetical protein